jgi:hypothetical protein
MSEVVMTPKMKKAVAARLETIREKRDGVLTPEDVVSDARSAKSPLHGLFTWDDKEAAHQHRLMVARSIIRSVKVEVLTETRTLSIPMYIRDPKCASDEQGYAALAVIKDDREIATEALLYEFKRAASCLERACNIAEGLNLVDEVQGLLQRMRALQLKVVA